MEQQLAGLQASMLFKGSGEVRDGRIAEHDRHLGNTEPFFVQQVAGMFHPLALIEVENGRTEHFLEAFLEVAFVDGHLPAEFPDREWFADMAEEDFPGLDDLFPVGLVGEEFTLKAFYFFFSYHAFQAIKEQHLALGIDIDVLQAIGIGMVQQCLQHQPGPAAQG